MKKPSRRKKPRRCWKMTATLLTDEAVRRERARTWTYGRVVLGLKPEPMRTETVWKKTWRTGR